MGQFTENLAALHDDFDKGKAGPSEPDDPSSPREPVDLGEELEHIEKAVRQREFLLRYGDYAGVVWNCLRKIGRLSSISLPNSVVEFDDALARESPDSDWDDQPQGDGVWGDLTGLVAELNREDGIRIDVEMAREAIRVYALRNVLCHAPRDRGANNARIRKDVRDLDILGADESIHSRDAFRRIVQSSGALKAWVTTADEFQFRNIRPNNLQREDLLQELDRGLHKDRLEQMYGKDGEAKRLNQPRPERAGSDPLPYVPTERTM